MPKADFDSGYSEIKSVYAKYGADIEKDSIVFSDSMNSLAREQLESLGLDLKNLQKKYSEAGYPSSLKEFSAVLVNSNNYLLAFDDYLSAKAQNDSLAETFSAQSDFCNSLGNFAAELDYAEKINSTGKIFSDSIDSFSIKYPEIDGKIFLSDEMSSIQFYETLDEDEAQLQEAKTACNLNS